MADSILLTHSDLKSLVQKAIDNRATVELLDPKQAYFQLKSALPSVIIFAKPCVLTLKSTVYLSCNV